MKELNFETLKEEIECLKRENDILQTELSRWLEAWEKGEKRDLEKLQETTRQLGIGYPEM